MFNLIKNKLSDVSVFVLPKGDNAIIGATSCNVNTQIVGVNNSEIHIRIYQRKAKCFVTTIEGLPSDLDKKNILSTLKKSFNCNGYIKQKDENDENSEKIISLTGDHRESVKKFLISKKIVEQKNIKIHGF